MQKPQKFPPPAVGVQQGTQIRYISIDFPNSRRRREIFGQIMENSPLFRNHRKQGGGIFHINPIDN